MSEQIANNLTERAPTVRRLLVAIPCLNEAATLASVIAEIPKHVPQIDRIDVLVVDDGSTDATAQVARDSGAHVVSHGTNRGVGVAFSTALRFAVEHGYAAMVNIDADRQFDAADIPRLVGPIVSGEADFVSASRFKDPALIPQMPPLKLWGNHRMAELVSSLSGGKFHDVSCGYRAYSREALLQLNLHGRFTYTQETFLDLADKGLRIREVPVVVKYFADRKSRIAGNLPKYAVRTASIIFRLYRDYHPLRFFWRLGVACCLIGSMFCTNLLVHYLRTDMFTGQIWSGFVGGAIVAVGLGFLVVGVVADMLDRMRRNQERILYLLKRGTGPSHAAPQRTSSSAGTNP